MQFLKILFWFLLAFAAALFTYSNWTNIEIHLWGGLIADVNLPMLLLIIFLLGLVPTYLYLGTMRWRLRQRLASCERMLVDSRAVSTFPTDMSVAVPAAASPIGVPASPVPAPAATPDGPLA